MPDVSIVIPCRNAAAWLSMAIESALAQTGVASEVIVVDDGSTDGSARVADKFGSRLTVLRQPASGGNVARNAGWRAARGTWVQFLDADDYLEPEKISHQLAEGRDLANVDVLYSPVIFETWRDGRAVKREVGALDAAADLWTQWITWQLPQTGGALWRRSALEALGGWKADQPCCQEHELYSRALRVGTRFRYGPSPGAVYRVWSEDTVSRRRPAQLVEVRTTLIEEALAWLAQQKLLQPVHRAAAGQVFLELARMLARDDLAAATAYYERHARAGNIVFAGPAAPPAFRWATRLLGFRRAEQLARWRRRRSPS